jgi:hypothetical protein
MDPTTRRVALYNRINARDSNVYKSRTADNRVYRLNGCAYETIIVCIRVPIARIERV